MATDDFFRARLDQMIDLCHPLAVLAQRLPWVEIEKTIAPLFAHKDRAGRWVADADLFGSSVELAAAGSSNAGRPRLPLRLMPGCSVGGGPVVPVGKFHSGANSRRL